MNNSLRNAHKKIAIVPARGGSKRIPKKNIKFFFGKPMIAWSIEAAKDSGLFDHIIVSTDDHEIAEVSKLYGAEVPFLRPENLSDDFIGTGPAVKHALKWFMEKLGEVDYVCTIYATAPFVSAQDINSGYALLTNANVNMVFTVTSYPYPIQRSLKINDGRVEMVNPENYSIRSQDLEARYHDAGQFYWSTTDAILKDMSAFSCGAIPLILPRSQVQDIDTNEDWERAELMFEVWRSSHQ